MSAIEGSTGKASTLADGTLRIVIDFPPTARLEAFALFGSPGTSVAVAALRDGHAMASDEPVAAAEPKGGPLSQWLAQRCNERPFREWLSEATKFQFESNDEVSAEICGWVGVRRKREIDGDKFAPNLLKTLVMKPYSEWLKKRGAA